MQTLSHHISMKKILFTLLLFVVLKAYSQTDITANMTGRWEINRKNYKADMLFVNNGKIAFLSTEGCYLGTSCIPGS
jgi:hypothetical protein